MIYKPQGTSTVAGCLQAPERVSQLGHTQRCCRAAKVLLKAKTAFNSSIPLLLHAPAPLRKAGILSSHLQSLDLSANLSAAGKMEFYKCLCKILPQLSHTLVLAWPSTYRSQGKDESRLKTLTLCLQLNFSTRESGSLFLAISTHLYYPVSKGEKKHQQKSPKKLKMSLLMSISVIINVYFILT